MKRIAKMALGAALAVAVIEGVFAFKAKIYLGNFYCSAVKTTHFGTTLYATTTAATAPLLFCSLTYINADRNNEVQLPVITEL